MSRPLSQILIRNTLYNTLGKSWGIVLNLILVPFLLSYLGAERFGLWALVSVVTGYFGLLDLGFGASFVKFISEYRARSDPERINQVIRTGILYYAVTSLVVFLLAFPLVPRLERVFRIAPDLAAEARFVLIAGLVVLLVQNTLSIFPAVINGLQRMDVTNRWNILIASVRALGMAACILLDYGLRGLMINQVIVAVLHGGGMMRLSYRELPGMRLRPWRLERGLFTRMFRFGLKVQISRMAQMISFQMDRVLVGVFFSVAAVAFYDLAIRISSAMRTLPLLVTSAIVPAASELKTKRNLGALKRLHLQGSRYLIFLSVPLVFFIVLHSRQIILAWVGPGFERSVFVLRVLAVGYFLNLVSGTASTIALGMGRPDLEMRYGIVMALMNLCLSIVLIRTVGVYGAALGSAVSLGLCSFYFMVLFHRLIGQPFRSFLRLFLWPLSVSVPAGFLTDILFRISPVAGLAGTRVGLLLLLGGKFVFFGLIYLGVMGRVSYFEKEEISLLAGRIFRTFRGLSWTHEKRHNQI